MYIISEITLHYETSCVNGYYIPIFSSPAHSTFSKRPSISTSSTPIKVTWASQPQQRKEPDNPKSKIFFPLSDLDCTQPSSDEEKIDNKRKRIVEEFSEYAAPSFFEDVGVVLPEKPDKPKITSLNDSLRSVSDYKSPSKFSDYYIKEISAESLEKYDSNSKKSNTINKTGKTVDVLDVREINQVNHKITENFNQINPQKNDYLDIPINNRENFEKYPEERYEYIESESNLGSNLSLTPPSERQSVLNPTFGDEENNIESNAMTFDNATNLKSSYFPSNRQMGFDYSEFTPQGQRLFPQELPVVNRRGRKLHPSDSGFKGSSEIERRQIYPCYSVHKPALSQAESKPLYETRNNTFYDNEAGILRNIPITNVKTRNCNDLPQNLMVARNASQMLPNYYQENPVVDTYNYRSGGRFDEENMTRRNRNIPQQQEYYRNIQERRVLTKPPIYDNDNVFYGQNIPQEDISYDYMRQVMEDNDPFDYRNTPSFSRKRLNPYYTENRVTSPEKENTYYPEYRVTSPVNENPYYPEYRVASPEKGFRGAHLGVDSGTKRQFFSQADDRRPFCDPRYETLRRNSQFCSQKGRNVPQSPDDKRYLMQKFLNTSFY